MVVRAGGGGRHTTAPASCLAPYYTFYHSAPKVAS